MEKKTTMKRILAVILTVAMLAVLAVAAIPASADNAAFGSDYIAVTNANYKEVLTFTALANGESKKLYLAEDITISGVEGSLNRNWLTGGDVELDGNGHTITFGDGKAYGLFDGGSNTNFVFKNLKVAGKIEVSGFAENVAPLLRHGTVGKITLDNVHSTVDITIMSGVDWFGAYGGMVGKTDGQLEITNSSYNGAFNSGNGKILANKPETEISNMYASWGGIIGYASKSIKADKVTVTNNVVLYNSEAPDPSGIQLAVGGVAGKVNNTESGAVTSITNCNSYGNFDAQSGPYELDAAVGGIVGVITGVANDDENAKVLIKNCYNEAKVLGRGDGGFIAGILAQALSVRNIEIADCVNNAEISASFAGGTWAAQAGILAYYNNVSPDSKWSLVSHTGLKITNCHNFGLVRGGTCGGIFGAGSQLFAPGTSVIENCSNFGAIRGWNNAGGIVGCFNCNTYQDAAFGYKNSEANLDIKNCYNDALILVDNNTETDGAYNGAGLPTHAGGIIGVWGAPDAALTIDGCYNDPGEINGVKAAITGGLLGYKDGTGTVTIKNSGSTKPHCNETWTPAVPEVLAAGEGITYEGTNRISTDEGVKDDAAALKYALHASSADYSYDDENHWKVCTRNANCKYYYSFEKVAHSYDNDCDDTCVCGKTRTVTHDYTVYDHDENDHWVKCSKECGATMNKKAHDWDNACDTDCNDVNCTYTRSVDSHDFSENDYSEDEHWKKCSSCSAIDESTRASHSFENDCSSACKDECGYTRSTEHNFSKQDRDNNQHWTECAVCGEKKQDTVEDHEFEFEHDETYHWKECACTQIEVGKTEHTFEKEEVTPATCASAATVREICECGRELKAPYQEGNPDPTKHVWGEWKADDSGTTHTRVCTTESCNGASDTADHNGGAATCTAKAVCGDCQAEYGDFAAHVFSDTYTITDEGHYKPCTAEGCTARSEEGAHSGKKAPTCTEKGVCDACEGEYGSDLGHTPSIAYTITEEGHYKVCTACNTKLEEAAHSGGTATCKAKKACDVCKGEYGEIGTHDGGTATCMSAAKCATCGETYGEALAHDFSKLATNGNSHWKECVNKGCTAKENSEAHSGGAATCTAKAECEVCGTDYGRLADHSYVNGACSVCQKADPNITAPVLLPEKSGGCGAAIGGAVAVVSAVAVLGCALSFKKKKD